MNPFFIIIILAVIEGLTEFLPVSSTGHMILAEFFLGKNIFRQEFMNHFLIIVQLGAILAVVVFFWKKLNPFTKSKEEFRKKFQLWSKIIVGVLPAAIIGFLLDDYIEQHFMNNIYIVIFTLICYGILLMGIEHHHKKTAMKVRYGNFRKLRYRTALFIGCFQCLAMIPGTSRSGATIIGALLLGVSRPLATEFSFYLAIPTMFGATLLKLLKGGVVYTKQEWYYLGIGTSIAFLVAYIVISWFMSYIQKRDFSLFGWYRILLGIIVLVIYLLG
ncbi:undecaprenyl-diphosphate phosphatase [Fusobacterium necrophorum]|uniref:undecaprenyl-diphosphate phosphatase n=1 Tax=Fusobacterium necrophorum TaxID=859 RepID=UPI00370E1E93